MPRYIIYDRERQRVGNVSSSSQVEAAVKAADRYNFVAYTTNDCQPKVVSETLVDCDRWREEVAPYLKKLGRE